MSAVFKYNQAISQCNRVSDAYQECSEASKTVQLVKQAIAENWSGHSGSAMYAAIEQWEQRLLATMSKLNALNIKMRQAALNYQQTVETEKTGEQV